MIAAGGTGGHVYPALATAEALLDQKPDTHLFFVGTVGGFERPLVDSYGLNFAAYDEVQAGPLHGVNPLRMAASAFKLAVGFGQALRLLGRHRPDAILSTGGWVSLPVALSAKLRGVPLLVVLPDIEPGRTIKVLRLFADKVAVTVAASQAYFKLGQAVVTGYALRPEVLAAVGQREQAIAHFGLDPGRKTVLVMGGSRGSRAVNIGVIDALPGLLAAGAQVIHITGTLDAERTQQQLAALGDVPDLDHYHAYPYLHADMPLALAAADIVVARSGAAALAEFPLFGLPAVLVPLAYNWRYQQINADYLADRGVAIHLDETDMAAKLLPLLCDLLADEARLAAMRVAAQDLAEPQGAHNIARLLREIAGKNA